MTPQEKLDLCQRLISENYALAIREEARLAAGEEASQEVMDLITANEGLIIQLEGEVEAHILALQEETAAANQRTARLREERLLVVAELARLKRENRQAEAELFALRHPEKSYKN
jgi:hypothetical protein